MTNYEQMAEQMYSAYCQQAGGLTFDGKPLPSFQELGLERQSCWRAAAEASCAQSPTPAATNEVTVLPDGSAFAVYSYPLPKGHWLYAPREYEQGAEEPKELAAPILTHAAREQVVSAIRYAVRGATDCGKETDFDPDALVQNAVYALCGPFNKNQPQPQADALDAERLEWLVGEGNAVVQEGSVGFWVCWIDGENSARDEYQLGEYPTAREAIDAAIAAAKEKS